MLLLKFTDTKSMHWESGFLAVARSLLGELPFLGLGNKLLKHAETGAAPRYSLYEGKAVVFAGDDIHLAPRQW